MLELKNLTVGYTKPLISNLNINFESKIYSILGESGRGKTTLLRTIAGLNKPLSGSVIKDKKLQIYMMHQKYTNFEWLTCLDNILITKKIKGKVTKEDKEKAVVSLKEVGLDGFETYYPTQLSGGMQQRLALARTLFVEPQVVLMDEPLSALDEETREELQNLIMQKHVETKNTIIMITHSLSEAEKVSDEIIRF